MARVITDSASILAAAKAARRVAVLGIKTEQQAGQPAYYVPEYLHQAGVEVIPVPVYYPDATQILGAPVYRRVQDVPGEIDIL
ncbi:MAG TPA: CoA-binding protein, partial [Polyangiales bacterium]|nr:CoA-binding protein [Polyangiales bacterium]